MFIIKLNVRRMSSDIQKSATDRCSLCVCWAAHFRFLNVNCAAKRMCERYGVDVCGVCVRDTESEMHSTSNYMIKIENFQMNIIILKFNFCNVCYSCGFLSINYFLFTAFGWFCFEIGAKQFIRQLSVPIFYYILYFISWSIAHMQTNTAAFQFSPHNNLVE